MMSAASGTLPPRYYKQLQKKGIKCAAFNPFRPLLSVIMNNRDHPKIFVVDGAVGFTGGINLADEYINEVNGSATGRTPACASRARRSGV